MFRNAFTACLRLPKGRTNLAFPTLALAGALALVPVTTFAQGNPMSPMASPAAPAAAPRQTVPAAPIAAPAQAAPITSQSAAPIVPAQSPQYPNYSANLASNAFGANLFTGAFAWQTAAQFNPNYAIAIGDNIQVRFWGALEADATFAVDPKGNIFLPRIGPVHVLGVVNHDLQRIIDAAVAKVYRSNVNSYASLAAAQPVRVFLSGFVNRPGLYAGTSMDSLLHYLDQAGGIDLGRGSFLNVKVKRGDQVRATISLYDFLLQGRMPLIQLADGDVIFVGPRQNTVTVSGFAENAKIFEFSDSTRTVADLIRIARPLARATHVRITRNSGTILNVEYYPVSDASKVLLSNGDQVEFTSDQKPGTITVRVQGEHLSAQEYVLPYGSHLSDVLKQVKYSVRSDKDSLQLFRLSVQDRQKQNLQTLLRSLETAALTASSGTSEEARLRTEEAALILQWVERAKNIQPKGQVVIAPAESHGDLLLENGDILNVPVKDGLVLVSGEVLFPGARAVDRPMSVDDYIRRAGGYTQNADVARIIVAHRDGTFADASENRGYFRLTTSEVEIRAGDEILVLPKIDVKTRQFWKDISAIVFQVAVSAKVILGL